MFLTHEQDVTERYYFFPKVQMMQSKINLYLNIPAYSLISPSNIKNEKKIC